MACNCAFIPASLLLLCPLAPATKLLRHRVSNKICENASFNKTNHNGQMPFAAKFIIPPAYGSDHSAVVLTSNKSPHATAVCSTPLLWVDMSTYLLSHPLRAPAQCLDQVSTTLVAKEICPPPSWATVLSQAFFTPNSRYRASLPYYIMLQSVQRAPTVEAASSTSWEEEHLFFTTTDEYLSKRLSQRRILRFNHWELWVIM